MLCGQPAREYTKNMITPTTTSSAPRPPRAKSRKVKGVLPPPVLLLPVLAGGVGVAVAVGRHIVILGDRFVISRHDRDIERLDREPVRACNSDLAARCDVRRRNRVDGNGLCNGEGVR